MIFIIIYIYSCLYLCIYTPSYPHFKAFPVSKFNSETSFLSQLFKENSNVIVVKPCKLINEAIFLIFIIIYIYSYLYLCIYTFILTKKFQAMKDVHLCMYACVYKFHSLKAMQDVHLCMYVCMHACVYKFHSETQVPLLLFRWSTRSNPPWMFFECRRWGWADAWYNLDWECMGRHWGATLISKKTFKLWFYNLFIDLLNRKVYSTFFFVWKRRFPSSKQRF